MAAQGGSLKATSINGVKMYTVSSQQRSLATWLPPKKQRALRKDRSMLLVSLFFSEDFVLNPSLNPWAIDNSFYMHCDN